MSTFTNLSHKLRAQVSETVRSLRDANNQLDRAMQRIEGSIVSARDDGLEQAARIAENSDSADGVRIAADIRALKAFVQQPWHENDAAGRARKAIIAGHPDNRKASDNG